MTSTGTRAPVAADAKGQSNRAFWDPRAPAHSEEESEDEENDPSSIADVFADMLSVNEDMILAAAECHADNDVEGTLAYQRILHRNLMEMANYIDSTFGVYGTAPPNTAFTSDTNADETAQTQAEAMGAPGADATAALNTLEGELSGAITSSGVATVTASSSSTPFNGEEGERKPSALLKTLEADEQLRVIKRSKKLWMKSRHQVREEESVSAIMNETAEKIAAIAVAARDDAIDFARSDLSHPFYHDSSDSSPGTPEPAVPTCRTSAPIRLPSNKVPIAAAPPAPPVFNMAASLSQLNGFGLLALLAPDALAQLQSQNPSLNMFFPPMFGAPPPPIAFPSSTQPQHQPPLRMMDPSIAAMRMQWGAHSGFAGGKPIMMPAPASMPVKPVFGRMCADCRNSHWSLHRCRVTLQHTAPEWVPTDTPTGPRKYTKRNSKAKKSTTTTTE